MFRFSHNKYVRKSKREKSKTTTKIYCIEYIREMFYIYVVKSTKTYRKKYCFEKVFRIYAIK